MKPYKIFLLLCFYLSINIACFSTNNDAEKSNLPSYDDTVKSGILKNTDNVSPLDYNEARTRDYLVEVPPGYSSDGRVRQPSRGESLHLAQSLLSQNQEKILEQIINLLTLSKKIDETILEENLFFLISKLSPEAINKPVQGASILYHLINLMDKRKISLLNKLTEHLLKERKDNTFEICDKPDTCNLSLHRAAQLEFTSIAKLIIDEYPETVKLLDGFMRLPIHYACKNGSVGLARLLLPDLAYFYLHEDKKGNTPLLLSIQSGNPQLLKLIAEKMQGGFKQALIDRVDEVFKAISGIVSKEIRGMLEAMIEEGLDINVANTAGDTLLHLSVREMNRAAVQWLIQQGADLTKINFHGDTPLFMALRPNTTKYFDGELVKDLVLASQTEKGQSIQQILQNAFSGFDIKLFEHVHKIIETCIVEGNADHLYYLAKLGVFNIEKFKTTKNKSALKLALEKRQYQVVHQLVKLGANVDAVEGGVRNINYIYNLYRQYFLHAGYQSYPLRFFPIDEWHKHKNVLFELLIAMFKRTNFFREQNWYVLLADIRSYIIYERRYDKINPKAYSVYFMKDNNIHERLKTILKAKERLKKQGKKTGILYEKIEETEI